MPPHRPQHQRQNPGMGLFPVQASQMMGNSCPKTLCHKKNKKCHLVWVEVCLTQTECFTGPGALPRSGLPRLALLISLCLSTQTGLCLPTPSTLCFTSDLSRLPVGTGAEGIVGSYSWHHRKCNYTWFRKFLDSYLVSYVPEFGL